MPRTILAWPMPDSWRMAGKKSLCTQRGRVARVLSLALPRATRRLDSAKSTFITKLAPALAAATPTPPV
ncbi:hypothetical protein D3C80_2015070 [compost metagenome]